MKKSIVLHNLLRRAIFRFFPLNIIFITYKNESKIGCMVVIIYARSVQEIFFLCAVW